MSDHTGEYKGHTKEYMWVFFALGVLTDTQIGPAQEATQTSAKEEAKEFLL